MVETQWTWSERKNTLNQTNHHLSFETAQLVFTDPYHQSYLDPCPDEERWQTYGVVHGVLIVVVHTEPLLRNGSIARQGRIISARKATARERKAFEEELYGA